MNIIGATKLLREGKKIIRYSNAKDNINILHLKDNLIHNENHYSVSLSIDDLIAVDWIEYKESFRLETIRYSERNDRDLYSKTSIKKLKENLLKDMENIHDRYLLFDPKKMRYESINELKLEIRDKFNEMFGDI